MARIWRISAETGAGSNGDVLEVAGVPARSQGLGGEAMLVDSDVSTVASAASSQSLEMRDRCCGRCRRLTASRESHNCRSQKRQWTIYVPNHLYQSGPSHKKPNGAWVYSTENRRYQMSQFVGGCGCQEIVVGQRDGQESGEGTKVLMRRQSPDSPACDVPRYC